ncbi:hypothetical protein K1T71_007339 [Dendrolimus kikuchii]|uniref:Uncharacterized protein n=1 Tax=Dendrolimus kikuchii TaxID=765133 RepID=A0ACC1D0B2_9NEOP|nr:hypothetical protein K1T71_007339 [Dendrolimus kikuchii]
MAVLAAAQLLDELMGRHRNTNPNEKIKKPNWEDPEYCKYYLVKFCPHDLFVNTRADLGVCPRVHDDEVKDLFEKAEDSYKKVQYVEEFLRFCRHMINDVERKIQKGKQRLELMNSKPEGPPMTQAQTEKNQEQVQLLSEKITSLVQEAEEAGTRGDVEQAQGLMKLCDRLKEEKEQLLKLQENSHWSMTAELAAAQEKQMEVCPVCGAFLIIGDAQQRIDDHLSGKQHVGYFKLRQAFDEMLAAREKEQQEQERKRREEWERERNARGGGLGSDRRGRKTSDIVQAGTRKAGTRKAATMKGIVTGIATGTGSTAEREDHLENVPGDVHATATSLLTEVSQKHLKTFGTIFEDQGRAPTQTRYF